MVEWVGLVARGFVFFIPSCLPQFFTRLAAVFAEEVGDIGILAKDGLI